jgi:hypothetical protein
MPNPDEPSATSHPADVWNILEPGQLTHHRSAPLPRAHLGARTQAALWALRITVLLLVFMVAYTFATQLWH